MYLIKLKTFIAVQHAIRKIVHKFGLYGIGMYTLTTKIEVQTMSLYDFS